RATEQPPSARNLVARGRGRDLPWCRERDAPGPLGRSEGEKRPMITMLGSPRRCCDGLTRRETLKAGALTALAGFSLPDLLRAEEARGTAPPGKAKSVILLYLLGGAATQDMIDLKPSAP